MFPLQNDNPNQYILYVHGTPNFGQCRWQPDCPLLTRIGVIPGTSKLDNKRDNHDNSAVRHLMKRYYASAEGNDTVCCFLDFQDIKLSPRNMTKPLTNFLEFGQAAQSESQ